MQNSAFNASMQLATMFERRRDNDDSFVEHSAFAYNEHRRNNFKRDRSFSHSQDGNDDMISCGSSINAEDGFDQCAYNNNYPVLDLDDDYDLIADLDQDKKLDKSSIHNSANITVVVQNPIEQNLDI